MKIELRRVPILFFLALFGACSASNTGITLQTPTNGATSAPKFVIAASTILPGRYLFVEFLTVENVASSDCGGTYYDFPNYSFENGKLKIEGSNSEIDLASSK